MEMRWRPPEPYLVCVRWREQPRMPSDEIEKCKHPPTQSLAENPRLAWDEWPRPDNHTPVKRESEQGPWRPE